MSMNDHRTDSSDWSPLPDGGLEKFASRQRASEARRIVVRSAVAAVCVLGIWGGLNYFYPGGVGDVGNRSVPIHAGLACSTVRDRLPDYVRGRLSDAERKQMAQHLAECPPCEQLRRKLLLEMALRSVFSKSVKREVARSLPGNPATLPAAISELVGDF